MFVNWDFNNLWMKFVFRDFGMICFELKSPFFSLMKRTKNQGCVIVVKVTCPKIGLHKMCKNEKRK